MRCDPTARCPNTYEIAITSKAREGYCIQCLGSVPYRGELCNLSPGTYTLSVSHDGRLVIVEQVVEVR